MLGHGKGVCVGEGPNNRGKKKRWGSAEKSNRKKRQIEAPPFGGIGGTGSQGRRGNEEKLSGRKRKPPVKNSCVNWGKNRELTQSEG